MIQHYGIELPSCCAVVIPWSIHRSICFWHAAVNDALCFDIASMNLQLFVILFKAALQLGLANLAVVLQQFLLLSLLIVLAHWNPTNNTLLSQHDFQLQSCCCGCGWWMPWQSLRRYRAPMSAAAACQFFHLLRARDMSKVHLHCHTIHCYEHLSWEKQGKSRVGWKGLNKLHSKVGHLVHFETTLWVLALHVHWEMVSVHSTAATTVLSKFAGTRSCMSLEEFQLCLRLSVDPVWPLDWHLLNGCM